MQSMEHLYQVVSDRREHPQEKSYTCYLFEQGLDKICKKLAKNLLKSSSLPRTACRMRPLAKWPTCSIISL